MSRCFFQPLSRSFGIHRIQFATLIAVAACLSFSSSVLAQDSCADVRLPDDVTNNTWFCDNNSDTVVVFVHGLNSSSRTAWLREKSQTTGEVYWPKLVLEDRNLDRPSVFLAGFYTGVQATNYSMGDAANELFLALSNPIGTHEPVLSRKNIVFVAHSLGGIIVRSVMVQHPEAFRGKRIGLMLVASPSLGSEYAEKIVTVAALVESDLVRQLAPRSPYLQHLDREFRKMRNQREFRDQITGAELVENDTIFAGSLIGKFLYGRVVEEWSAVQYFTENKLKVGGSDHFTIAQPTGLNDPAHLKLVEVFSDTKALDEPVCEPPPAFQIDLALSKAQEGTGNVSPTPEGWPSLRVRPMDHNGIPLRVKSYYANEDPDTGRHAFSPHLPFPCPGDLFRAVVNRVVVEPEQRTGPLPDTSLCFKRSSVRPNDRSARLQCREGETCNPDEQPGLAEPCRQFGWHWPGFITPARAQPSLGASRVWAVPSLETLANVPNERRPGYSEFFITSPPLVGVEAATHISHALTVNDVPVFVDGLPPHQEFERFNGSGGVRLRFALENLGFTGGDEGYEQIGLELKFWEGEKLLRTVRLQRPYVSYRHAPALEVRDPASGDTFQWSGYYRPSELVDRFEILVATAFKADEIRNSKNELDRRKREFDGSQIVGVIRPPREDGNGAFGVALGAALDNGQIKSSFTREEANAICRWIWGPSNLPTWMKKAAYLYEFPVSAFTEKTDRGVYRGYCPQT